MTEEEPARGAKARETEQAELGREILQQAEAAAVSENDRATATPRERRHLGHDVSLESAHSFDTFNSEQDVPPPAYGEHYGNITQEQEGFGTDASVADDGRVNIRITQRNRRLSNLLVPTLGQLQRAAEQQRAPPPPYIPPSLGGEEGHAPPPPLNVVIQVVGSRGDVQPFVALGKVLKERYGHRVRLATHPNFKDFVTENGLEFFSIGGDPQALMAFMVKNPGLMPGFDSLRTGDVGKRRKEVAEYLKGCWRSCFETGDGGGPEASDDNVNGEEWVSRGPQETDYINRPFVADCIIANPPSFAHVHCAEKLGIPLHIMFTMPYSPTQAFPHPLANIQSSNADDHLTNYMSYALIDMLTWQGLGDIINRFRMRSLGLDEISLMWAPGMLQRLQIPHTYCWSPALIPKPKDWGANINISGFYFLDLATNYTPDPDLKAFLDAGPPPVYIGFGSIVLDDPNAMTELLFEAVKKSGQRALISKGWGGMGADELGKPDDVFMLGNIPHDWLFKRVSCVVHHGGAGTTAAGITAGRPTVVVPFFGDQQFWGNMVCRAGAGPEPIPHKQLTADNLSNAILKCLEPQSLERAKELADKIAREQGSEEGAQSFHQFLDVDKLRCNLAPSRAAVWRIKRTQARLSAMAACTLAQAGLLDFHDLKLARPREYETDEGPWDPVTGATTALVGTISTMMLGVADFPIETLKALKIHPETRSSKSEGKKPEENIDGGRSSGENSTRQTAHSSRASTPRSETETNVFSDALSQTSSRTTSTFNFQDSMARMNAGPLSPGAEKRIPSSMAEALSGQLNQKPRSRSGSGSRPRSRKGSLSGGSNLLQTATDTGKGVNRILGAGFKAPMEFSLGVAKGFHNAPKLYGDETVRQTEKVTDFQSGLKVATKEVGYGLYDGITGLVTQPFNGARKEGAAGFIKGIGKGIGGIILKPSATIFAIPGYTMRGVYKEMQKHLGSSVQNYIIAARTAQGFEEYQQASEAERRDVIVRWKVLQQNLKKKRNPDELVRDILKEQMEKKEAWLEAKREKRNSGSGGRSRASSTSFFKRPADGHRADPDSTMLAMGTEKAHDANRHRSHTVDPATTEERAVEEAIRLSVLQTSQGDPEEDARVEQGIRASVSQIPRSRPSPADQHEEDQIQQALDESAAEHERRQSEQHAFENELQRVLTQSLREQRGMSDPEEHDFVQSPALNSPTFSDTTLPDMHQHPPAYDQAASEARPIDEKTQREKTEEEIVLEYVKKQSMLEEEHRSKGTVGSSSKVAVDDEDDEELQRVLKLSMQGHEGREASDSRSGGGV